MSTVSEVMIAGAEFLNSQIPSTLYEKRYVLHLFGTSADLSMCILFGYEILGLNKKGGIHLKSQEAGLKRRFFFDSIAEEP